MKYFIFVLYSTEYRSKRICKLLHSVLFTFHIAQFFWKHWRETTHFIAVILIILLILYLYIILIENSTDLRKAQSDSAAAVG